MDRYYFFIEFFFYLHMIPVSILVSVGLIECFSLNLTNEEESCGLIQCSEGGLFIWKSHTD